MEVIA